MPSEEGALARERAIGQLEGRVKALEGWVENVEKVARDGIRELADTVRAMDEKLDALNAAVNRRKGQLEGGYWAAAKIAASLTALAMLFATAWKVWH